MDVARAVGGDDHQWWPLAVSVPISGIVIWKSLRSSSRNASNSWSARPVRQSAAPGHAITGSMACSSGRFDEVFWPRRDRRSTLGCVLDPWGSRRADMQHLTRVVPLINRGVGVQALVALEPDQGASKHPGQSFGNLGLADARSPSSRSGLLSLSVRKRAVARARPAT